MARIYKSSAIYDATIIGLKNLWEPSREYMGKPVDRPNYLTTVIMRKTRGQWWEEPSLAAFAQSCSELYNDAMSHIPFQQIIWPIRDGDVQDPARATAEWGRGHWILNGSSSSPIDVSIIQNGVPMPLPSRIGVKPGDKVAVTTAIAVKINDPRGVKCYINKVQFREPGEEIVIGSSVSNAELMERAKAQGLNVTGFGGGGAPQKGFPLPGGEGFAPMASPVSPSAPAQFGQAGVGNASFPSNGPQSGFAPPPISPPAASPKWGHDEFARPTGFPPRQ